MNLTKDQWAERYTWLRSLGLTVDAIRVYRLDRYQYMTELAWDCMVREALRLNGRLSKEQRLRVKGKYAANGNSHQ